MTGQWTHSVKATVARRACRQISVAALSTAAIMIATSAQAIPQPDVAFPRPVTAVTETGRQAMLKRFNADGQRQAESVTTGLQAVAGLLILAAMLKALRHRTSPVLVASRARRRPSK